MTTQRLKIFKVYTIVPPSTLPPDSPKPALVKLKTGRVDRRWSLAKAGFLAGARHAGRTASGWLLPAQQRRAHAQKSLTREAVYFIEELSKLKGSVVKVGQMMALWGDAFFPATITQALHALENQTAMMDWPSIHQQLMHELGSTKLCEFSVQPVAIGCASLAQVHRATHLIDEAQWCPVSFVQLKVWHDVGDCMSLILHHNLVMLHLA